MLCDKRAAAVIALLETILLLGCGTQQVYMHTKFLTQATGENADCPLEDIACLLGAPA